MSFMKKLFTPLVILSAFILSSATCHKKTTDTCFKGRLEIKGLCMNYVIKVIEGKNPALEVEKSWKDDASGKTYENVFALASKCNFPDLKEGEEFYFTLTGTDVQNCAVCQAFRPVPTAKNAIKVITEPCRK